MSRRRVILGLDVLGEVRRAMRILRRVERYLLQEERRAKRIGKKARERFLRNAARPHPIERADRDLGGQA